MLYQIKSYYIIQCIHYIWNRKAWTSIILGYSQVLTVFIDIMKSKDVGMVNQLHDCNFSFNLKKKCYFVRTKGSFAEWNKSNTETSYITLKYLIFFF